MHVINEPMSSPGLIKQVECGELSWTGGLMTSKRWMSVISLDSFKHMMTWTACKMLLLTHLKNFS